MSSCYLCGTIPATRPLELKKSFTAHSSAACPGSNHLCDRCEFALNTRAYYWNKSKEKYSLLYARGWSWLYQGDRLLSPRFRGEYKGFPVVKGLATRAEMRWWLLEPPDPPFTIAIAESGQKHILFLAKEAQSRDFFPVLLELDTVWIDRQSFEKDLAAFEDLLGLGASKTEIVTGDYKSSFLLQAIVDPLFDKSEQVIAKLRGKRYLGLISHVAQKPEPIETTAPKPKQSKGQLSLF